MTMMKEGKDSEKARKMMTEAEQMMKEGEAVIEKGSKMGNQPQAMQEKMKK